MEINQYSKNGESICIDLSSEYVLLIDAGFYYPFKNNPQLSPKENVLEHLKQNFSMAGNDLIGLIKLENFQKGKYALDISSIKYRTIGDSEDYDLDKGCFGIDTGEILIIEYKDFELFTVEAQGDLFDNFFDYQKTIQQLNKILGRSSFAIIESPGFGSGFDFEGDGSYYIENNAFKSVL